MRMRGGLDLVGRTASTEADRALITAFEADREKHTAASGSSDRGRDDRPPYLFGWFRDRMNAKVSEAFRALPEPRELSTALECVIRENGPEVRSSLFAQWFLTYKVGSPVGHLKDLLDRRKRTIEAGHGPPADWPTPEVATHLRIANELGDPYASCQSALWTMGVLLQEGGRPEQLRTELNRSAERCSSSPVSRRLARTMVDLASGKAKLGYAGWVEPVNEDSLPAAPPQPSGD